MADGSWYYSKAGQQLGPVSDDELRQKIASGEVTGQDLVWRDGMANWQAAASVPELARTGGPAPYPAAGGGFAPPAGGYTPAAGGFGGPGAPGQPIGYAGYTGVSFAKDAQTAMICSIIGLVCCGILGIVGLVLGNKAKNNMRASGNFEGQGMATAAIIMGWISIGLMALYAIIQVINLSSR